MLLSRTLFVLLLVSASFIPALHAQQNCDQVSTLPDGYTVSISSVTANVNGSYTITLTVINDGCSGCKKLNSFLVQAAPGTYSNVIVTVLSGSVTWASIDMGPNLSGTSLTGFRINNTNGIGNGQAAAFSVTYTVTTLQNQQTVAKAGTNNLTSSFTVADFLGVLSCLNPPPPPSACSYVYSDWSACSNGTQTRTVISATPEGCTGTPELSQTCQVIFPYFAPIANKIYDIIGVELTSLYHTYLTNGTYISDDIFQIIGTSVRVSILTQPGEHENAVSLLTSPAYGLVQELDDPEAGVINGTLPILNLLSLNLLPDLLISARPIYAALTNAGLITSQGDSAMRSFRARDVFRVNGQGVKVGVLSDSYNTIIGNPAGDDVERKDLPGPANPDHPTPVHVLLDYPYGTRTDEGRAMLQIVHDVAPGAELAFRTGFLGAVDFAKGIRDLQQAGCHVIVDDISYISEPMFRDGVVAKAVNDVKAQGVTYFTAAGNFGSRSWQGNFAPVEAPAGVVGQAHNFANGLGPTDIFQSITLYQGDYTIVFQWDDGTTGTKTSSDFDIYLTSNNGSTLFGFNRSNIGGDPMEILPFKVAADSVQSNIMIVRESGSGPAVLKYIVYRGNVKINEYSSLNSSTITGHANAEGAISVGAVLYTNTPQYGGVPTVASFSSRGGTLVNGSNRSKPDLCAPNGVNTSVDLGGFNYDGDAFPNFFGTSAAAPHAAGVAALLLEAKAKYHGGTLTPDGVKTILQGTALDMHTPGYDALSGAGYILADSALLSLANPAPFIHSLSYDGTLTPGIDPIPLAIHGEYLTSGSTVWLDDEMVTNEVVVQGNTAYITIEPFNGLYPAIRVKNPSRPGTNGLDGGFSNPLYFTDKQTILVTVGSATKKFGESLPPLSATYTLVGVDGSIPLASADLTQAELDRIQGIAFTTNATSLSNVGLWAITTDPADPLSPNSSAPVTDPLDISILEQYTIVQAGGLLTIEPADLTITPRDTTFYFNEPVEGLTFNYVFNGGVNTIPMDATDATTILNAVKSIHGTALVNGTGLVRGTALVNGEQVFTDAQILNLSMMISQAVTSIRGTALVNGELIDPEEFLFASAFTNAESRLVRGTALVNGFTLVRGTALVNTLDSLGSVTGTSSLSNPAGIANSTENTTTITLNSNSQTLVILGDEDIEILSGNEEGTVVLRSVNLITGNTVGTHRIIPGTFLSNNFNVTYGLGNITILPASAEFEIEEGSLTQTFTGGPISVDVTVQPDTVPYTVTYNGSTDLPVNVGTYDVVVAVNDPNYTGTLSATLVIESAPAQIFIPTNTEILLNTQVQTYSGGPQSINVTVDPADVAYTVTYNGSTELPVAVGTYDVVVTVTDPNYTGSMTATFVIESAPPVITGVGPTLDLDCSAPVEFSAATAVDNCSGEVFLSYADVTVDGICDGNYSITRTWTATDNCGNSTTASQTINVTDVTAPVIEPVSNIPNVCATGDEGAVVTFALPSATDNCSGVVSVNAVPASGSLFPVGTTTVTVTAIDACGNGSSSTFTVHVTTPVVASAAGDNVLCFGGTSTLEVSATGGTAPYSGTGEYTVSAGPYSYTVTDANGCTSTVSGTITEPILVTLDASFTSITCHGADNARIIASASAGASITVDGTAYNAATSYGPGIYEVCANAPGGVAGTTCTACQTLTITEPAVLAVNVVSACDDGNGSAQAMVDGGTAPYGYLWSNGLTSAMTGTIANANYTVDVTDANGCMASGAVTMNCLPLCMLRTQTQGGWGSSPSGTNAASYLFANFAAAFPQGVTIGCGNGGSAKRLRLTTAQAANDFLPSGSSSAVLPSGTLTNPGQGYQNAFAGQLVSAKLNVRFDVWDVNYGPAATFLGDAFVTTGPFMGWTVNQVIAAADNRIGGCGNSSFTLSQFTEALSGINGSYANGDTYTGYLSCAPASTTKILENNSEDVFEAFPNPVGDLLTVKLVHGSSGVVTVDLVDLSGRMVQQIATYGAEAGEERIHTVNTATLSPGVYLISVMRNDERAIKRIVVYQ
jgi:hypothetical protein